MAKWLPIKKKKDEDEEDSPLIREALQKQQDPLKKEEEEDPSVIDKKSPLMQAAIEQNQNAENPNPDFAVKEQQEQIQKRKDASSIRAERLKRLEKLMMQVDEELHKES